MYKLLIKKSFYDGWDNILFLFLLNTVFTACILLMGFSEKIYLICIWLFVFSFHLLGANGAAYNMTRCESSWYQGYVRAIKKVGHFILYYIMLCFSLFAVCIIAPFYLSVGNLVFYSIGFSLLFVGILLFIALMYFFPLALAMEKDGPFKTLKKCFIILFDNFWFSIYCLMKNICDIAISIFTMFLMPGITGACITLNNAVYFMMLRYDWMDEKKVGKHDVSADMYLAPVFELYNQRNLRTLFFPWKNN